MAAEAIAATSAAPGEPTRRLFFALWPDQTVIRQLLDAERLAQQNCDGRPMRADSLHITLVFIGAVAESRIKVLQEIAAAVDVAVFELRLNRLVQPGDKRLIWAACDSVPAPLRQLAASLRTALNAAGFPVETRPFTPHVTLLRNARCVAIPATPIDIAWPVRDFALVESKRNEKGSRYRIIGRWSSTSR